ncbi:hypothetical protein Htur_4858 (plasmid) [Haloterrigena turkmenica DSM 5511]|uniref:Uncharacterized protein n=1 Tax=Haloterrigena turkmenica (strain ATCC 51198 / DSM 5511 / JCM 9101 / NCIMB 13204 / VKM B-1734 / 4k) TaxID=543526 RepID=D2S2L9_HALTV|nr:hypothetical protein [Haloterrigena turkmenica]ADB63616.1 hypothetical protein Htur_4858 [Haloterrigena turkmenica DSM 5511]
MDDRFSRWLLLSGGRFRVATGILFTMAVVVLIPLFSRFTIRNLTPVIYIASALIGGNITLITLVVAINQVILSQELESPGSLRDEIDQSDDYRQTALDQPAPPTDPADFLQQLLQQTQERAGSLAELLPDSSSELDTHLIDELPEECAQISEELGTGPDKLSSVIVPLLGIEYATHIHECHQLESDYEGDEHEQLLSTLDSLSADLKNLDIARQYFTTTFIKEELAKLSRSLLYVGVLAISLPVALLIQLATFPTVAAPLPTIFVFTLLTVVVSLIPLALLIAFILRVATVAQNIASITPFMT